MIIFKDEFSGHEMFTDSNKITKDCDDELLRVTCREVTEEVQNDFDIGANASQEEQAEDLEKCVKTGVDVCLNQHLEEVTHDYTKKLYMAYLKTYLKKIVKTITDQDELARFQEAGKSFAKEIQKKFDDIQFFRPEKDYEVEVPEEEEPFVIPLHRDPDTQEITMIFFRRGLKEEKA